MSEYVEMGYIEPNYVEGDETVMSPTTCDLSTLEAEFVEVDLSLESINQKIEVLMSNVGTISSILGFVNTRTSNDSVKINEIYNALSIIVRVSDLANLVTKSDIPDYSSDFENLTTSIEHIILPSLNGNGSEYKDGIQVKVSGREAVYTVERSYHSLYSDNGYTVHYDLVSSDGYRVTAPEALLTKYTPTVV